MQRVRPNLLQYNKLLQSSRRCCWWMRTEATPDVVRAPRKWRKLEGRADRGRLALQVRRTRRSDPDSALLVATARCGHAREASGQQGHGGRLRNGLLGRIAAEGNQFLLAIAADDVPVRGVEALELG